MSKLSLHAIAALACLSISFASAEALKPPIVVYDNALKNNWSDWSWAKVTLSVPIANAQPIKVEGAPWTALYLHHEPFSTEGFSKLTFVINGGTDGGQKLMVKLSQDEKPIEAGYRIELQQKNWALAEIALKDLGAENTIIDGVIIQGMETATKPYYITRIKFE